MPPRMNFKQFQAKTVGVQTMLMSKVLPRAQMSATRAGANFDDVTYVVYSSAHESYYDNHPTKSEPQAASTSGHGGDKAPMKRIAGCRHMTWTRWTQR